MYPTPEPQPTIAKFFGVVSLFWALSTLGGVLLGMGLFLVIGVGGWLVNPIVGAVGSAIGVVAIGYLLLSSFLSFLLLSAGWKTLQGDPRGISQHRTWAWLSIVLDAVSLLVSGGIAANGYFGLIYAVAVLYFTTPREIHLRWEAQPAGSPYVKPTMPGDSDF